MIFQYWIQFLFYFKPNFNKKLLTGLKEKRPIIKQVYYRKYEFSLCL